ncbi:MAG: hypothetical protein ABSG96_05410 [Terracidiphilus sp.]|jgi:hypothetical protein
MKNRIVSVCVVLAMLATAGFSQAGATGVATKKLPIEGVWRADQDGLPFIALTITNESGSLSGAVLFYFHRREAVGQPWTSTPGSPGPIFNPMFDGKTLTFQVSHRYAHPPESLNDPPSSFRLTLTGVDKAGLTNITESRLEGGSSASPGLPMTRSDY